jgi:hypothetical protein
MTRNPILQEAAEKALVPIVKGQQPSGGWDYNMALTQRADTSYMGWCAQALKAAQLAGLEVPGLEEAYKKIASGMLSNYQKTPNGGGFGYVSPGTGGLTAVGALSLQITGYADSVEVRECLKTMDNWRPVVLKDEKLKGLGGSLQYYLYYATQCIFQSGGPRWERWDKAMRPAYTKAQKVISATTSGYKDHDGKPQSIGWWENEDDHSDRPVMDTCLAALQLTVYYRYLPTYSVPKIENREIVIDKDDVIVIFN